MNLMSNQLGRENDSKIGHTSLNKLQNISHSIAYYIRDMQNSINLFQRDEAWEENQVTLSQGFRVIFLFTILLYILNQYHCRQKQVQPKVQQPSGLNKKKQWELFSHPCLSNFCYRVYKTDQILVFMTDLFPIC